MLSRLNRLFYKYDKRIGVVFIYNEDLSQSGSTIMRVNQLSEILHRHYNNELKIRCRKSAYGISGSVIILNKNSISQYTINQINEIRKYNKVLIDPVDASLDNDVAESVDGVIAASKLAYESWSKELRVPVFLVNHHADPRIKPAESQRTFKCGYFGELGNTVITPQIEQVVKFVNVGAQTREVGWEKLISKYALHYSIRRHQEFDGYKPFTKGFIAAKCRSNIIVGVDDEEALSWLGEDYPYICKDMSEGGILDTINYAKSTYGGEEWDRGLDVMNKINQKVSIENISSQLHSSISGVYVNG